MFDFLKRKYKEGKITDVELNQAVEKEWITKEQMIEIKNSQ